MNCKPGDLAIVTFPSRNAGMIVEIIRPSKGGHYSGLFSWYVRSAGAPMFIRKEDGSIGRKVGASAPDAWLKPVSGLPINDEVTDDIKGES
jgi:hypothetical protein